MFELLRRLWHHISPRRRSQFLVLLVLMVITSFAEMVSISAVLPFLGILTAPRRVIEHPLAQTAIELFGLNASSNLLGPITIFFGLAALVAGAMRLLLLWASTRLCFGAGADLSISIYRRTLYQPYCVHVSRNSSEVIAGVSTKTNTVIFGVISPLLTLISSSVMLVTIVTALIFVDPVVALSAFGGFGLLYIAIIKLTKRKLYESSQQVADASTSVIKALQEGLGGIRDVLIDGVQHTYCQIYSNADLSLRSAQGAHQIICLSPRYGVEAIGLLLIAALAYVLVQQDDGISKAIPVLGALALGAQRLLPALQQAYSAWSTIRSSEVSLYDSIRLLDQPLPHQDHPDIYKPIPFDHSIRLEQIGFRYTPESPWVLKDISLLIPKGSRVGIIGSTGSGKSTLLDIVMGLLQPTVGYVAIDEQIVDSRNHRAWQARIAHVPQAIFLTDNSIEENIAFGIPKDRIDHERVREAARKAQMDAVIESWGGKYKTRVGERGVRLSGGQRQRIGIARALYKNADVIIFDEATSALDNETEKAVMKAIEDLGDELTIFIIAHRLSTLRNCTHVVELSNGVINRVGSYHQLIKGAVLTKSTENQ